MSIESAIESEAAERLISVKELHLFDANMWLGKPKGYPLTEELAAKDVAGVAARYHLEGGLISNWDGAVLSPQDGNEALEEAAAILPEQVSIVWNGLPLLPREQDPLPGYGKPAKRTGGIRLFPKTHRYILKPWVVGSLSDWCVQYHVPLFLWHVEAEWDWVYETARAFPKLNIVIESQWQKILYHNRTLYNLMESCPGIYLEISNFSGQDFLAHGVKTFGAERFIYGSFLPMNDPLVPAGLILDAEISREEKLLIAGENMRNLLKGVAG